MITRITDTLSLHVTVTRIPTAMKRMMTLTDMEPCPAAGVSFLTKIQSTALEARDRLEMPPLLTAHKLVITVSRPSFPLATTTTQIGKPGK
jgi:hypothetical protein